MKLPTAKKLPSGSWRVQVMVDGRKMSVTAPNEKEAIAQAAALKAKLIEKSKRPRDITLGEAVDRYIESKNTVLSPSSVYSYKKIKRNLLGGISDIKLLDLTQEKVQRWVNALSKTKSPKTVQNAHGFLSAVLSEFKPEMSLRTTLPQKIRHEIIIPSEDDIRQIIKASIGTKYELPILLAIWLGLRESEIRGLTWGCISGDRVHIKQAVVQGEDGDALKGPKSTSGDRMIRAPQYILDLIAHQPKRSDDYIIHMSGKAMYSGLDRICKKIRIQHYRFHDLRHVNASVMLALGVPDKYAMQRMGHATNNMLKTVYQHTMEEKMDTVADEVDQYFEKFLPGE